MVGLLAVEESRFILCDGEVKWLEVRDVHLVDVHKVGVDFGAHQFSAGSFEGRLGKRVVESTEVEVELVANVNFGKVRGIELEDCAAVEADRDGSSGASRCAGRSSASAGDGGRTDSGGSVNSAVLFDRILDELVHLVSGVQAKDHTFTTVVRWTWLFAVEPLRLLGAHGQRHDV